MVDRPNIVARTVAQVRLSIRSKIVVAFLGITLTVVGLALFSLNSLQQANDRTEAMIRDQERIAFFNDTYVFLAELGSLILAPQVPDDVPRSSMDGGFFGGATVTIRSRVNNLEAFLGRNVRQFGRDGMPDAAALAELRASLAAMKPAAIEVERLGREETRDQAAQYALESLWEPVRRMQRSAYSKVQEIEAEMRERANVTARAYLASRQNILASGIIAVGLSLLLGYSLSASLLWPITRIRLALGRLAGGYFDALVSVPNRDELGELAEHVNETSVKLGALYDAVETQKAQLADLNASLETKVAEQIGVIERTNRLRRFLPAQVADMIVAASDGSDPLATRRAEITVLFADLRGFTSFANVSTPDQVVGALNTFHETCGPLVEAEGGTLERFLGDGLMVLFGAPVAVEDAADRAIRLAMSMRETVSDALQGFQSEHATLGLGIGVATGVATLGQIGFEGRRDYSAIGPAPNLAARLCDLAKDGQILVSHATVWQTNMAVRPSGKVGLKGIGEDIAIFEV